MANIPTPCIHRGSLKFLSQLRKNNHKDFMDANRDTWNDIRKHFCDFTDHLIAALAANDASVREENAKTSVFRINRDIRFSKNKEPYKSHLSAFICKGGRKSAVGGYYLHLEPGNKSFLAAGMYEPPADVLFKVRQEIDYNGDAFVKLMKAAAFRKNFGGLDASFVASRQPRGFDANSPFASWICYSSYLAVSDSFLDKEVVSENFFRKAHGMFRSAIPLNQFLNQALDE